MTLHDPPARIAVWDIGVRLFHWTLAAAVVACLLTGFLSPLLWLRIHLIAGSLIAALLFWRVVWGVIGTAYARFGSFAYTPRAVLAHLRDLATGRAPRHLGHNPLGAMMVFALLLALAVIIVTGVIALGGVDKQGPLADVSFRAGSRLLDIHLLLAWLLVGMIAAHLAGVAAESWRTRENLALAMLSGRKPAGPAHGVTSRAPRTLMATLIVGGGLGLAAIAIAVLAARPPRGVPPATVDPTYALQCGACHLAYPPSLAPAGVWAAILAHPLHHFGAEATLGPQLNEQIGTYLADNSAERWDSLPAHRFRRRDPENPLRITATPFWRKIHASIPAAVFAMPKVGGKAACDACHQDASTGRFAPQEIAVPVAW